jgi:hypothetical protein
MLDLNELEDIPIENEKYDEDGTVTLTKPATKAIMEEDNATEV